MLKKTDQSVQDQVEDDDAQGQDDDDFDAAFDEFSGNEQPQDDDADAGEEVEDKGGDAADPADEEPSPSEEAAEKAAESPNENSPPSQEAWEKVQQENRSNRGRVSALQKQNADLQRQLQRLTSEQKPPEKDAEKPEEKDKGWEEMEQDYPEIAGPVQGAVTSMSQKMDAMQKRLDVLEGRDADQIAENNSVILADSHGDWQDVVQSDDFSQWFESSPKAIQDIIRNNAERIVSPNEAAAALDLFKAQTGWSGTKAEASDEVSAEAEAKRNSLSAKRKAQMKSAGSPSSNKGKPGPSGPPDDFDTAFDHYASR